MASLRRRLWRATAVAPVPLLVPLWALWRDVYALEATGPVRTGGSSTVAEWALLSAATLALAALFWAGSRALRLLGATLYSLLLAFALGVSGVMGVVDALGGPRGDLQAPAWAIALLGLLTVLCFFSLLATAGLMVEDIKSAGGEVS
jgi:hypothetical protein